MARQLRTGSENSVFLGLLDARIRSHWYYWLLGRRLGARVRDRISSITNSSTWNFFKEGVPAQIAQIQGQRGADKIRYIYARVQRALAATSKLISKRDDSSPRGMVSRHIIARPESRRREKASQAYGLAVRIYHPRPYPGRIAVIANEKWCNADRTLGWTRSGGLDIYTIPGNHNTYRRETELVADALRTCLYKFEQELTARPDR
jgi:hypothetical protein